MYVESPFVCLISVYLTPSFNLHFIHFIMLSTMTFSNEHSGNSSTMVVVTGSFLKWCQGKRVLSESLKEIAQSVWRTGPMSWLERQQAWGARIEQK